MKYRDNAVKFLCPGSDYYICGGSFTIKEHRVTTGQDPDKKVYDGLKTYINEGEMTFKVGRKGSKETAKWFNDIVPIENTTFAHQAGELNFAFIGTLELVFTDGIFGDRKKEYKFEDIAICQGHAGASNNWWFAGRKCYNAGYNMVICYSTEGHIFLFRRGHNGFIHASDALESFVDLFFLKYDLDFHTFIPKRPNFIPQRPEKNWLIPTLGKAGTELAGYGMRVNEIFVRPLVLF